MTDYTYPIQRWLDSGAILSLPTADYWNDESLERKKQFWKGLEESADSAISDEMSALLQQAATLIAPPYELNGIGISLGSGSCWLESTLLARSPNIQKLICVEMSEHRISVMAPRFLQRNGIDPKRVQLCLGSFYDLKVPDNSADFVILCQAFHHAFKPEELLSEVCRALKPSGQIVLFGEHWFPFSNVLRRLAAHAVKFALNHKDYRSRAGLTPNWRTLFPVDKKKGDHHYNWRMYQELFSRHDLEIARYQTSRTQRIRGFILKPKAMHTDKS